MSVQCLAAAHDEQWHHGAEPSLLRVEMGNEQPETADMDGT